LCLKDNVKTKIFYHLVLSPSAEQNVANENGMTKWQMLSKLSQRRIGTATSAIKKTDNVLWKSRGKVNVIKL